MCDLQPNLCSYSNEIAASQNSSLGAQLYVIGVAAGNFFSAAFEDRCAAVAGASGGIFGLLGLFIADMVLNFETLTR